VGFAGRWVLLAQVALIVAASSAARPMISYRALELGAGGAQIGLLATTFALLPVLLAFAIGRRIDARGPAGFLIAGSVVLGAGGVLSIVTPGLVLLYVATAAMGMGQLMCVLAQQAAVAASSSAEDRDRAFGWFTSATAVGLTAGPPAATFTAAHAERFGLSEAVVGLLVGVVLSVGGLVVAMAMRRQPMGVRQRPPDEPTRRVAAQIVRTRGMWQALVAGGTVLAALDLLSAFLPLWANDRGISIGVVGLLLALRGVCTLLARLGTDRLIRTIGRRPLLAGSILAGAGGLAALTFVDIAGAVVVMVVLGIGLGLAQPLTMSWVTTVAAPGTRGAALGLRITANRIGQATIPATIAAVAAGSGANGIFWGAAAVLTGASAAIVRAPMERPPE
jgi:MFS family permease